MRALSLITLCVALIISGGAYAGSNHMTVGAPTSVPAGWKDFCGRYTDQCGNADTKHLQIVDTDQSFAELSRINKLVNARVHAVSDMDHWGVIDQWDLPNDNRGDCEDYVLEKRRLLIEEGVPPQVLLFTIARDKNGEGHAVLTAHVQSGDYILDNMTDDIHVWYETSYTFIKRQSYDNQGAWVLVDSPNLPTASIH